MTQRYDATTQTLWISSDLDEDSLLPSDELETLAGYLQAKKMPDGRPVGSINVVFTNRGAAEYNESALSFSRVGTFVGTLNNPSKFSDSTEFGVKEDFGVKS